MNNFLCVNAQMYKFELQKTIHARKTLADILGRHTSNQTGLLKSSLSKTRSLSFMTLKYFSVNSLPK